MIGVVQIKIYDHEFTHWSEMLFLEMLKKIVICFDDKSASKDDKDRIGNKCFEKSKDV